MAKSKNFSSDELKCSCCGEESIQQWALDNLQFIRDDACRPLKINSAYRCENHPEEAKKAKGGTHTKGIAFDIAVHGGAERMEIIKLGLKHGATGLGVADSFVPLDWRDGVPGSWKY